MGDFCEAELNGKKDRRSTFSASPFLTLYPLLSFYQPKKNNISPNISVSLLYISFCKQGKYFAQLPFSEVVDMI